MSIRDQVQSQAVQLITRGLETGAISEERARNMAKLVLESLPENMSEEDLMLVIPKLDDEYKELSEVVIPIMRTYEEKIKAAVEQKILALARARKFDEATELAKRAIALSSQLT